MNILPHSQRNIYWSKTLIKKTVVIKFFTNTVICKSNNIHNNQKHSFTSFRFIFSDLLQIWLTLGHKMALSGSLILTVPQWFLLPSGLQPKQSVVDPVFVTITSLFCFLHQLFYFLNFKKKSYQPWNSLSFIRGCSDGILHITEGSKYKSKCRKNGNYNKSFDCQGEEQITVELQDPFCNWAVVKMRETMFAFAKIQSNLCYLLHIH